MSDESFLFGFRRYVIGLENSHQSLNQPKATFVIILCYDWLLWLCCDHLGLGCKILNQKSLHKHRGNRNGCRRRDKNEFRVIFFDWAYVEVPYRTVRCKLHTRVTVIRLFSIKAIISIYYWNCKSDKATQLSLKKKLHRTFNLPRSSSAFEGSSRPIEPFLFSQSHASLLEELATFCSLHKIKLTFKLLTP